MSQTNIMEVEVKMVDGKVQVWFVALAGEQGPKITMPLSIADELHQKLGKLKGVSNG